MAVEPSGPDIVTSVVDGVMVTEGGILIGSRPMIETFLQTCAVELKQRERRTIGGRGIIVSDSRETKQEISAMFASPVFAKQMIPQTSTLRQRCAYKCRCCTYALRCSDLMYTFRGWIDPGSLLGIEGYETYG